MSSPARAARPVTAANLGPRPVTSHATAGDASPYSKVTIGMIVTCVVLSPVARSTGSMNSPPVCWKSMTPEP